MFVPSLPGCITWGKTLHQARKMAVDAIEGYLKSLIKHGEPIPVDDENLTTMVEIEFPTELFRG